MSRFIAVNVAAARTLAAVTARGEYEVRNRIGTLLFTSPDMDIAKAWLRDRALQWPGAQVEEVTRWESRRRVFKPVAYLRAVPAAAREFAHQMDEAEQ